MRVSEVLELELLNNVCDDKVAEIAESIRSNGWQGAPILVHNGTLLTGSHRVAALRLLEQDEDYDFDYDMDAVEDVTDIVDEAIAKQAEEFDCEPWDIAIDYDNIGWLLEGSWVEDYKDEMSEW